MASLTALALTSSAAAGDTPTDVDTVLTAIPEAAFEAPVLVIGERHQQPRSHGLTLGLIRRALADGRCVTFALEIPIGQTPTWRAMADDPAAADRLKISSIHDGPSLRHLLQSTAELARNACFQVNAVDWVPFQDITHPGGRDWVMAKHIADLAGEDRLVIALMGNNHAPRHLDWDHDEPGQSTTYYLAARGIRAYVLIQDWVDIAKPRVLHGDSDRTVAAYVRQQWPLSVVPAETFTRYADRLIQWPDEGHPRSAPKQP